MNYLAIIVCGIAALIIGMAWYSRKLFGMAYAEAIGMNMNMPPEQMAQEQKKMPVMLIIQLILSVLEAAGISYFLMYTDAKVCAIATWIFIGFHLPVIAGQALWSGKSKRLAFRLFLISAGSQLVTLIVFTLILSAWR